MMFSFPLIKGDASKALSNPNSIVLTESFARQLLGDKEPFGETISIGESGFTFPFVITGILKDLPSNTDFQFDYLVSWKFLESIGEKDTYWGNNSVSTFVKLKAGEDVEHFNELVKDVAKKHSNEGSSNEIFLYPLTKMRLYSEFQNGVPSGGRIEIIRMLGVLGFCLIAIACINFINLSTARAQKRSKEVGIRKVTGADRYSLISQFLCESVLVALGAGIISVGIVYLSLPWFSSLIRQPLTLNVQQVGFWLITFSFIAFIGVLAGGYPAFYLSSFHPVRILKGATIVTSGRSVLRQLLVVFQFGFAIMLIVSVIVISKQIEFAQNREVGYDKNHLIYHSITGDLAKNYQAYKNELLSSGIATSVTQTSSPITERWSNSTSMQWRGKDPQDKTIIERFYVDEDISTTAGLTLLEGRDMDLKRYPSDSTSVLLNEAAVKLMGFKQPLGEIIEDNNIEWHVIGVVKDFVLTSPLQKITPIVLQGCKRKEMLGMVHIRLNQDHTVQNNIATISALFSKFNPAYPFEYNFVDDAYQRKFAVLETTLTITSLFGFIAIFISCLGLLGLSTFMIETRTKEIGIRKVLGSSVTNIVKLLSTDAIKPILIAGVIFSPIAWYALNWWLQSFDYRISIDAWIFLAAGVTVMVIALVTISVQTFGAANADPVKTLRSE
jgi:ABC-type antimicrobial peptide transport system permease subunit